MKQYPDFVPTSYVPETAEAPQPIPDNLFALTSHGTWKIPDYQQRVHQDFTDRRAGRLSLAFTDKEGAIAMDGSDFAVGALGQYIASRNPDATVNPPLAGRMFINPNAPRETALEVPTETFGGTVIWYEKPSPEVQEQMVKEVWDTYHARAQAGVERVALETPSDEHVLLVDIHDTDPLVFNKDGKLVTQEPVDGYFGFPLLLLSNQDGQAAHPLVQEMLGVSLAKHLLAGGLIDVEQFERQGYDQNEPYKGGFTTKRYGMQLEDAYLLRGDEDLQEKAQHMHFIQIELNRSMYILPDRSGLDDDKIARTQVAVANALAETAGQIRDLPLGRWRSAPEVGSEAYETAMKLPLIAATDWYKRAASVGPLTNAQ